MVTTLPVHNISLLYLTLRFQHYLELIYLPEAAIPYAALKSAGFSISFATETSKTPECDKKMLTGWTKKLLVCSSCIPFDLSSNCRN